MNSYILSKKIHRILVLLMAVTTIIMVTTGVLMKYRPLATALGLDSGLVRTLHNIASPFYAVALILMAITGSVMYFYPMIVNGKR